jgi:hypothetical protein
VRTRRDSDWLGLVLVAALLIAASLVLLLVRAAHTDKPARPATPQAALSLQARAVDASVVSRGDPRDPLPTTSPVGDGAGHAPQDTPIDAALQWARTVATYSPAVESGGGGGTPTPAGGEVDDDGAQLSTAGDLPQPWYDLADCESTLNTDAVDPTGTYFGLFQFDLTTWQSVGGSGNPADASVAEQLERAERLYAQSGGAPWPVCWPG